MDSARQQIVESIKANTNILVTVSTDPSVDELSAALGLTILLNNLEKRAIAVMSGAIPPAITFLEPDKTFENTADSLRDFIIALDKEKADHLRYKVDGDMVKIFITPYKTTLSDKDLEFSQGDYNVELVIALGVQDQDHLDKALAAHGKILHDATVATVTAGDTASKLGTIDLHDAAASSLSEIVVGLADALKTDKSVLDEQIATAFLTGIVSATDRFSNSRTSSRVMTMAAQLMAAGANQQLIAAKLEEANDIGPNAQQTESKEPEAPTEPKDDISGGSVKSGQGTELSISRSSGQDKADTEKTDDSFAIDTPVIDEQAATEELEKQLEDIAVPATPSMEDMEKELQQVSEEVNEVAEAETKNDKPAESSPDAIAPLTTVSDETMPGFEVPELEPAPQVQEQEPSPQIDSPLAPPIPIVNEHGSLSTDPPSMTQPINSTIQDGALEGEATVDPFGTPPPAPVPDSVPQFTEPLGPVIQPLPAPEPEQAPAPAPEPQQAPEQNTVPVLPPLPPLPPMPSDSSLPPLPPLPPAPNFAPPTTAPSGAIPADQLGDIFGNNSAQAEQNTQPAPAPEPGQFKIPGQG